MKSSNIYAWVVAFMLAGIILAPMALAAMGVQANQNSDISRPIGQNQPITLNSVAYALSVVRPGTVLIPNPGALGPTYRIIGVQVVLKPENDTTSNGITYRNWVLQFIISDKPFTNATTMSSALSGHEVVVSEGPSTGYYSSHDAAVNYMTPPQVCRSDAKSTVQYCETFSQYDPGQLVQIRNTWLVVHPDVPNAYFSIDGFNRTVSVYGELSYQQMLVLSGSMIP